MKMPVLRVTFRAMASENELQLIAADPAAARRAADAAIADVQRIEAKYSRYLDDSVTTRINRAAGGDAVTIDAETAALLDYAQRCHELSGGLFDITAGVLRRCWDFRARPPRLPESEALVAACALIGWSDVERDNARVRLPRAGMEIDFGGIGKEYAADRAATILRDAGVCTRARRISPATCVRSVRRPTARRGASASGIRGARARSSRTSSSPAARSRPAATTSAISISTGTATATSSIRARGCPSRTGNRSAWWRRCASSPEAARRSRCCRKGAARRSLPRRALHYIAVGPDGTRVGDAAPA